MYAMAIDAGTGSVRAVLFDEAGREVASASRPWVHLPVDGVANSMQFDTATNTRLIFEIVEEVLGAPGVDRAQLAAISATAMREGIVCLDADGNEVWACANVDARAVDQVIALAEDPGVRAIYERTGQTFALAAQPRLAWIRDLEPATYERIDTVLMLSEWVLYILGGAPAMEPTNGSTSGLLNILTRQADNDLLTMCSLKPDLLPPVKDPGTVIGSLKSELAERWGLSDVKIVLGGGDTQMAALGCGMVEAGQGLIVGGTFWQQAVNIPAPRTDPDMRVRVNCAAEADMWWAEAIAFHVGTTIRWFRDCFAGPEVARAKDEGRDPLQVLDEAAEGIPAGSLGITPVFSDVMNYKAWKHAAPSFLNLPLDADGPTVRAAMYRSLLENAAIVARLNLALVAEFSGVELTSIVFAGGGAKSKIWAQILADVTGLEVSVPVVKEATAAGAALCAMVGVGAFPSIREASLAWVAEDYAVSPRPEYRDVYAEVARTWKAAYAPQLALTNEGITQSLWQAPGS